jgi:hypothetical protein
MLFVSASLCILTVKCGEHGHRESRDPLLVVRQWVVEGSSISSTVSTLNIYPGSGRLDANIPTSCFVWIALWSIMLMWLQGSLFTGEVPRDKVVSLWMMSLGLGRGPFL